DKATFDLEAESDGTLEIIVEKGVPAKIGAAIARIGAGGAAKPAEKKAPPPKAEPKQEAKPKPETVAEGAADNQASEPAPPTRRGSAAPTSPRRGEDGETAGDIKASPLAKRIADEMGVDLRAISGTGPDGRIVKEDVLAAAGGGARSERRRPESPAGPSGPEVEVI